MDIQIFIQTINEFDHGLVQFKLGENWSFIFNKKWYPTHAFMNRYGFNCGIENEINLYKSTHELSKLIPITSSKINFNSHNPIEI
jgi:hypothetical protein